jgi:hypothetical protein
MKMLLLFSLLAMAQALPRNGFLEFGEFHLVENVPDKQERVPDKQERMHVVREEFLLRKPDHHLAE